MFVRSFVNFIRKLIIGAVVQILKFLAEKPDQIENFLVFDQIWFVFWVLGYNDSEYFLERLSGWIVVFTVEDKRNFCF